MSWNAFADIAVILYNRDQDDHGAVVSAHRWYEQLSAARCRGSAAGLDRD